MGVRCGVQIGTTKGTGGDVLVLEEAAYCDEGFFYETVAPILSIGSASLVAISTLTSEINFYTRLIKMVDPATERPLFAVRCIELCCDKCKEDGKAHECVHMLHLVPRWQSEERHRKLKVMMQDRPDLIQSELAGLAFDSLQQVFRKSDIELMFSVAPLPAEYKCTVWVVIDPAAGGPQSDYAVVSIVRTRGTVTVSGEESIVRQRGRSGDHVRLLARVDEVQEGHLLACEEGVDVLAQVGKEAPELASVAGEVRVDHVLLEVDVNVEEHEEDGDLHAVWMRRVQLREPGQLRGVVRGAQPRDRGGDGLAQRVRVDRVE